MSRDFIDGFHAITNLCIPLSFFIALIVLFLLWGVVKNGTKPLKAFIRGLYQAHGWKIIIVFTLSALVVTNSICYFVFRQDDMNALYENKNYTQNYEAYLYENKNADPLFCIAEITHNNGNYTITKINFSQGIEETEIEYDPDKEFHYVYIDDWDGLEFSLRISHIADNDSFYRLSLQDYDFIPYNVDSEEIEDTIVSSLNGSYECISIDAVPLTDLPATEKNVFFIDECQMNIYDGHITMWDDYGDYGFGPIKVAPDDSPYEFVVYAPSFNEETGETIEEDIIIAYIDKIDYFTFDMVYTEEGDNDYFTNIIARFQRNEN